MCIDSIKTQASDCRGRRCRKTALGDVIDKYVEPAVSNNTSRIRFVPAREATSSSSGRVPDDPLCILLWRQEGRLRLDLQT